MCNTSGRVRVIISSQLHKNIIITIYHEYFVVNFSVSLADVKIKRVKNMHIINGNAVQCHLSENYSI